MSDTGDTTGTGDAATPEDSGFRRTLTLAEARRQNGPMAISADEQERAAIAARFGLLALNRLDASLRFAFDGDTVNVSGSVEGDVVQTCVATNEPLPARVVTPVDVRYVPLEKLEAAEAEAEIELGENDLDIIGYTHGRVDVGAMIADTLYLALDPFPRRRDADKWLKERGIKSEAEAGAFGALAGLRDKLGGNSPT